MNNDENPFNPNEFASIYMHKPDQDIVDCLDLLCSQRFKNNEYINDLAGRIVEEAHYESRTGVYIQLDYVQLQIIRDDILAMPQFDEYTPFIVDLIKARVEQLFWQEVQN
jgi:hypothetical protein